jgi:hypothetical protein
VILGPGYARVEATQRLFNPNTAEVEAILHVPLSAGAVLAEVEVVDGEAAEPCEARLIENGDVEIRISRLAARRGTRVRWIYYEALTPHRGEGRYVYPGPSAAELPGRTIWQPVSELDGVFRVTFDPRFAEEVSAIAAPGFAGAVDIVHVGDGHPRVTLEAQPGELGETVVLTYRIGTGAEDSPEVIADFPAAGLSGAHAAVAKLSPGMAGGS